MGTVTMETVTMEEPNGSSGPNVIKILQVLIACSGITTNLTVVVVFLSDKLMRKKIPNICIINQSLIDASISLLLLIIAFTLTDAYTVQYGGALGWLECLMWNSEMLLCGLFLSSTWNIVTLTFERYLELVHPIWHRAHFNTRWLYVCFGVNWLSGISMNAAYMIPTQKVIGKECIELWPSPEVQKGFGVFLVFIEFLIPLMVLIYCYGRIIWVLRSRIDSNFNNGMKFEVIYLMHNFGFPIDWNGPHYKFSVVMVFLNCTVNPFIYLFNYKDFQNALKNLFCRNRLQERSEASQMQTVTSATN